MLKAAISIPRLNQSSWNGIDTMTCVRSIWNVERNEIRNAERREKKQKHGESLKQIAEKLRSNHRTRRRAGLGEDFSEGGSADLKAGVGREIENIGEKIWKWKICMWRNEEEMKISAAISGRRKARKRSGRNWAENERRASSENIERKSISDYREEEAPPINRVFWKVSKNVSQKWEEERSMLPG